MADQLNKKELLRSVQQILQSRGESLEGFPPTEGPFLMKSYKDRGFAIWGERLSSYNDILVNLLRYRPIADRWSEKTLDDRLGRWIADLLFMERELTAAELKENIDELLRELEEAEVREETYYFVIENLHLKDGLEIGRVKLQPLQEGKYAELSEAIAAIVDRNPHYSENQKRQQKEHFLSLLQRGFEPRNLPETVAEVCLSLPDHNKGHEIALVKVNEVLHVLRFLGRFIYSPRQRVDIGLRGDISRALRIHFSVAPDLSIFHMKGERVGPHYPYELYNEHLEHLQRIGLSKIGNILLKEPNQRSPLERRLVNSIVWISKATQDPFDEDKFLSLCISMESLLCRDEKEAVAKTMAERLAFLLSTDPEKRRNIYKKGRKIYNIRSRLAHEGKPEKDEDVSNHLPYASHYAEASTLNLLQLMTEKEWTTFEQFAEWIEELKFGSKIEEEPSTNSPSAIIS